MHLPDKNTVAVIVSAIAAAASFAGFAIPLLMRQEKKERYREVIEKKRRALFEQAKEQANRKGVKADEHLSAAKSILLLYKFRTLAGVAADGARSLMLQAGIRQPMAPLYYLGSQIVLPLFFMVFAAIILTHSKKEMSHGMEVLIILGTALIGFLLPRILIKNTADKRQQDISLAFPDSLDMMLICVQGGIGIEAAINRIAETVSEHSRALAEELGILSAELGMLNDRKAAFKGFAGRVGSGPARSFATAMLQAEQYGTSISKALRVLADESRDQRMALAEQKAASLPPKLTVPMIAFFLPALFIVILGPAFIRGIAPH